MDGEMSSMDGEMPSIDGEMSSVDVIHGWRDVIHGWKCHPWMSSMDDSSIRGCHPWMKTTDDGHGRSIRTVLNLRLHLFICIRAIDVLICSVVKRP